MPGGFGIKVQLTGLADLHARLETMKRGLRNRIVRGALLKAGTPIKKAVKGGLTQGRGIETKLLYRSIDTKSKTYSASGVVILVIGPRGDFRQEVDVSRFTVYRQVGGIRGKTRRGKFTSGIFGKTVRITNPNAARLKNWPSMIRNPVKYAHLVEKGITARGRRDKTPFLEKGFAEARAEAERVFRDHVETELDKLGIA